MDRELLKEWLGQGLSLNQIGALANRDPSTVGYWVKKHGLVANGRAKHSPKGGLPRDELEALVSAGRTLADIAESFDVSIRTVRYWVERYGLPRPISIRRSDVERATGEGRRTLFRDCDLHGWTVFVIENSGRARCRRCRMERVAAWRRKAKATLIEEVGGECVLCGYDRCQAALQFHHLDPSEKSFALSLRGVTKAMAELRAEAAKCIVLCANCHAEVEVGFSEVPVIDTDP
jgi:hypothetical protein